MYEPLFLSRGAMLGWTLAGMLGKLSPADIKATMMQMIELEIQIIVEEAKADTVGSLAEGIEGADKMKEWFNGPHFQRLEGQASDMILRELFAAAGIKGEVA